MDNRSNESNDPQADMPLDGLDDIWARVVSEKDRINALIPTPMRERDWQRLKAAIKQMIENIPAELAAPDFGMCQKFCSSASDGSVT